MITHYHEPTVLATPVIPNGIGMILSMNRLGKHVYAGTVTPAERTRRRERNKRARAARRAGRA